MAAAVGKDYAGVRASVLDMLDGPEVLPTLRYHPLGFLDATLRRDDEARLQLHIWDPLVGRQQTLVSGCHSHGWLLTSFVLVGQLTNVSYEVVHDARGSQQLYEVTYGPERAASTSRLAHGGRVQARVVREQVFSDGDVYDVLPAQFHATRIEVRPLVTVVIGDMRGAVAPQNVRDFGAPAQLDYQRLAVAPDVVRAVARRAADAMRGAAQAGLWGV
jgi:hypothetical protein